MERETLSILISVVIVVSLVLAIIILFLFFHRKKNNLLIKQKEVEKHFEQELAKTQIEIHEATLSNISWELHDNIGQLITLAKIQLQNNHDRKEIKQVLDKVLNEVRSLSKSLNPDVLKKNKLTEAIDQEINLFNRLKFIEAEFEIIGKEREISNNDELILFRILQEFFTNVVKHAGATKLLISLHYKDSLLEVIAKDNGRGFDLKSIGQKGIGLSNMSNRAKLLNAEYSLNSIINNGTTLSLKYFYPSHED